MFDAKLPNFIFISSGPKFLITKIAFFMGKVEI